MSKHAMKHVQYKVRADAGHERHAAHVTNLDPNAIAIRAYELWRQRGSPQGSPETDWFEAERQLNRHAPESFVG